MKLCVLNFSGNVGKSTVSAHLLQPRLPGSRLFSVESLNDDSDGADAERVPARHFAHLQREILDCDAAVVDVGSSNVEAFIKSMQRYEGSHLDYDLFVVPAVKERKQVIDTINTLQALLALGVAPALVRVVLNRVEPEDDVETDFDALLGFLRSSQLPLSADAVIRSNEAFPLLKGSGLSLREVIADPVDYRARLRQAESGEDKELCLQRIALRRLAGSCVKNLDVAFKAVVRP